MHTKDPQEWAEQMINLYSEDEQKALYDLLKKKYEG